MRPLLRGTKRLFTGAVLLLAMLAGPRARADEPDPPNAAAVTPPRRGFGAQIVLADLGMLLLGGVIAAQTQQPFVAAGAYAVGAPAVHVYHGDYGGAGLSFVLHATLPLGLGYLLYKSARCADDDVKGWCEDVSFFLGASLGVIAATTVDAAALSPPPFFHDGDDAPTTVVVPVASRGGFALRLTKTF
jgi:hypothetical protein